MIIFMDDQPVHADEVDTMGTLNEAVRGLQSDVCPADRLIVRIRCDGHDISGDQMKDMLEKPIGSFDNVELFTSTKGRLVADAMNHAAISLDETNEASHHAGELLSEGNAVEGIQRLGECLHVWQQIHDAIAKSIALLEIDAEEVHVQDEPLSRVLGKPRDVLMQVKQALEVRDLVLLADVLLYDFEEVTDQWRRIINCIRTHSEST
jgi:hypothetical protein